MRLRFQGDGSGIYWRPMRLGWGSNSRWGSGWRRRRRSMEVPSESLWLRRQPHLSPIASWFCHRRLVSIRWVMGPPWPPTAVPCTLVPVSPSSSIPENNASRIRKLAADASSKSGWRHYYLSSWGFSGRPWAASCNSAGLCSGALGTVTSSPGFWSFLRLLSFHLTIKTFYPSVKPFNFHIYLILLPQSS